MVIFNSTIFRMSMSMSISISISINISISISISICISTIISIIISISINISISISMTMNGSSPSSVSMSNMSRDLCSGLCARGSVHRVLCTKPVHRALCTGFCVSDVQESLFFKLFFGISGCLDKMVIWQMVV